MFRSSYGTALLLFSSITAAVPFSQSDLTTLNQTCQGRLFSAAPLSRPCFTVVDGSPAALQQTQCSDVHTHYASAEYRADHYSGFMHDYNEICASSADNATTAQCLLDPIDPTSTTTLRNFSCGQGSVSRLYIEVTEPDDVKAAFAYARKTGQTLSIKNSGHDYGSRSSLKGSLALWTRKLQHIEYNADFVPEGCGSRNRTFTAMTVGAGVNFEQAYEYADQHNVTFVGGSSPTVGASGGFPMTGGHGLLTSQFGLGIDRVLQYKIVTPDGVYRTANMCQNKELYWALRGGGGGTFGVVIESTHKVEPRLDLIFSFVQLPVNVSDVTKFVAILMEHAPSWAREGWGGPNGLGFMAMVNPFLSLDEAKKSMEPLASYASSVGGTVVIEQHSSFLSVYTKYVQPAANLDIPAASFATNRLVPSTYLSSDAGKAKIQNILSQLQLAGFAPIIFQTTPAYYQSKGLYREGDTSATSAWRDSVWMITGSTQWAWNSTLSEKFATVQRLKTITEELEVFAPDGGSYASEADPWTVDWQNAWWGKDNYAKLLQIKHRYDPFGLLSCWRCVGWEERLGGTGERFECMGGLDR